jgi:hypothetical protein
MHSTGMEAAAERRSGSERRHHSVAAHLHGARRPRRRDSRRSTDRHYPIIDWHSSRVFALVMAILGLCVLDAVLTVILMSHGAEEANPIMALLVPHELGWFAAVKLALTGGGVCILVACSRMRMFRTIPGEALLYGTLLGYIALIVYELRMLSAIELV